MESKKRLNPNWKKRIKEIGKNNFELEEMLRLGFYEVDKENQSALDALSKQREESLAQINNIETELAGIRSKIKEAQDTEKLLSDIREKRIIQSKIRREQRKQHKLKQKKVIAEMDKQKRLRVPPFLGRKVSGRLQYDNGSDEKLALNSLPLISDVEDFANALELKLEHISWLCYHREVASIDHYKRFFVPKRNGKHRLISAPKSKLKHAQGWINQEILNRVDPEKEAMAFRPSKSILDNAIMHSKQGTVVRIDLADFFPSISFFRVRSLFHSFGYSTGMASIFALLCTDSDKQEIEFESKKWFVSIGERKLPQGAPSSPSISNLVARQLDKRIRGFLKHLDEGWIYTRYADDLVFSNPDKKIEVGRLLTYLSKVIENEGFSVNPDKTIIMRAPYRQTVTGLVLGENGPRIQKQYLRRVRAMLHNANQQVSSGKIIKNIDEIKGKLAFIKMVMPNTFKKLTRKYDWLYQ